MRRWVRVVLIIGIVLLVLGAAGMFVMFGPPHLAKTFSQPEFCLRCHPMKPHYETFKASTHGEFLESCNDCHLPNDNPVEHYAWDGVVGVRDLVEFNFNLIPEHIQATPRSRRWLEDNCRRCHAAVISDIHPPADKRCWDCHRGVTHDIAGRTNRDVRLPIWEDPR